MQTEQSNRQLFYLLRSSDNKCAHKLQNESSSAVSLLTRAHHTSDLALKNNHYVSRIIMMMIIYYLCENTYARTRTRTTRPGPRENHDGTGGRGRSLIKSIGGRATRRRHLSIKTAIIYRATYFGPRYQRRSATLSATARRGGGGGGGRRRGTLTFGLGRRRFCLPSLPPTAHPVRSANV